MQYYGIAADFYLRAVGDRKLLGWKTQWIKSGIELKDLSVGCLT